MFRTIRRKAQNGMPKMMGGIRQRQKDDGRKEEGDRGQQMIFFNPSSSSSYSAIDTKRAQKLASLFGISNKKKQRKQQKMAKDNRTTITTEMEM
jgi:hypothetical protein